VWDLIGRFDEYVGHQDFADKSVLDVGTATGLLTFEAERRGARVTSFDAQSAGLWYELPIPGTKFVEDYSSWRIDADRFLEGIRNSYWLCHEELGSTARCFYGDVYELEGDRYDVVIVGQVLVHLRDGLSALAAAAGVCGETLIVVEGNLQGDDPVARLCAGAGTEITYSWYHYSHGWYREVMKMLGFRDVTITTDLYTCNDSRYPREIELATAVATR
jgi:O-methyltransferase